ncbi:MAG: hypothetical protein KC621_24745, partial [Myxococcales bacterium]|nr:hypothetical protein [Myxococcales bacterium]
MWMSLLLSCATTTRWGIAEPGPYSPSFLRAEGDLALLARVETCGACHAEQAEQWRGSAHAHASFDNPWYRHAVEDLREGVGLAESKHCAGCHDPVLLLAGKMDGPVLPTDPGAAVGVPCLGCHGVVSATSDGNASVLLDLDLEVPTDASTDADIARHKARMLQPALTSGAACGACHRGFLGPETGNDWFAIGMDDAGAWRGSTWGGSDAGLLAPEVPRRATCVDCHLDDHRATGAHTPMVPEAAERVRGAASVWVGAVWVDGRSQAPEEATPAEGSTIAVDVVVRNTGTGHRFPGGTLDAQDTWVALEVSGPDGVIASVDEERGPRLRARVMDAEGVPVETHQTRRMVAVAGDHTVPPGDARAFRFELTLDGPGPYTVSATLRHRRHPAALQEAACAATTEGTLDGCVPEPVTEVDADRVVLGEGTPSGERAWTHALALSHDVQERLDDARPSAERALALATTDREAAAAGWVHALIAGRQGRL